MKRLKILSIVAMAAFGLVAGTSLQAQIREQQPAEFPTSSYKGKQYVDSNGCVFVRAGIDGNVTWVPRVSRDRKIICGFKPTGGSNVAETVEPAAVAPAPKPAQVKAKPAPVAKPAPRRVAKAAPKKRVAKPVVVRQTAPRPAPKPQVATASVAVAAPTTQQSRTARGQSACQGASALSQQYLRGSDVRCGPQSEPVIWIRRPVEGVRGTQQATRNVAPKSVKVAVAAAVAKQQQVSQAVNSVTATTRIAPRHVVKNRQNTRNVTVPKGYKRVWEDGRLNPKRAEQNLAGRSDMLLVWTQTVPRRLINQNTGQDVTTSVPLVFPYTSIEQQRRHLGEVNIVQRDGQILKRIVRNPGAKKKVVRKPVYSSRSTPKAVAPKAAAPKVKAKVAPKGLAGKRYVQVGTFKNADNAKRTAQKVARMGMPARIGTHRKGGKKYLSVQAGPFDGAGRLNTAMKRLRGAGFSDAFAR